MLLVTAEAMRALEARTFQTGCATGIELMARAGVGVVDAVERRWGTVLGLRALVCCGTGNNGGDGFVAARRLRERGAAVRVVIAGDPSRIGGDAKTALESMRGAGIEPQHAAGEDALRAIAAAHDRWDFAFDALLGTGARGAPEGAIADAVQVLREIDEVGTPVVAIDLPTGVDADTGAIARRAVRAELTVTFGEPKRGHLLFPGRAFVGALEVVDIGLAPLVPGDPVALVRVTTAADVAALVPRRDPRAHKGRTGRVLVIGGSLGLTGAVTMTARAASRAGAGYVTVAVPESLHDAVAAQLDSQIPLVCPETTSRALAPAAYEHLADAFARADVVALGPGLSLDPESAALARRIALETPLPVVIDADALTALAADPSQLARAAGPRVLTPHLGEMSRLTKATAEALEESRIDAPRAWAAAWRATVLLKGAPTVTAGPDARTWVNPTGNPGMAMAGMGDVLTGVVAALLAQGLAPTDAAMAGAYVHGEAGDRVAARLGGLGMLPSDVTAALPETLAALARMSDAGRGRGSARP